MLLVVGQFPSKLFVVIDYLRPGKIMNDILDQYPFKFTDSRTHPNYKFVAVDQPSSKIVCPTMGQYLS